MSYVKRLKKQLALLAILTFVAGCGSDQSAPPQAKPQQTAAQPATKQSTGLVTTEWAKVDCAKRQIVKCPHDAMDKDQTTPLFKADANLQGRCRDGDVDPTSFCGL